MKVTMADVWRPIKGVKIKEATPGLFLFQFAHALDMEVVLQGGPWAFNNQMLIMERVQLGVQLENIPLQHVDFWVQVHNLPTGLMAERVGKTLANYIGSFVEYDKNNNGSFWREYMRIRVRVDIRQPLKKDTRVKNQGGQWCTVKFKYEKLGVFCFVCGLIGHGENRCAVRFSMSEDDGSRAWSKELRAEPRRRGGRQTSRWLTEDDDGRKNYGGDQSQSSIDEQVNHTRPFTHTDANQPNQTIINQHSLICPPLVPLVNPIRQEMAHNATSSTFPHTEINTNTNLEVNQRMIQGNSLTHQPVSKNQPLLTLNVPDNSIISQSMPKNNQPTSSFTISPIINDALKNIPSHQFSFNASSGPNPIQHTNPVTRPIKNNPNHKLTKPGPTRTGSKPGPNRPTTNPNHTLSESMEVQAEKKRRRDNEKEKEDDSIVVQHFLTAGPGSQACRDQ
jgi:14-3-3 protein epsilon